MPKKKSGPVPRHFSEETRAQVQTMAGFGIKQEHIALILGIGEATLQRRFKDELTRGAQLANTNVIKSLYKNAVEHNNVAAQIFWAKARCGWRETPTALELTGVDGKPIEVKSFMPDFSLWKPEDLIKLLGTVEKK